MRKTNSEYNQTYRERHPERRRHSCRNYLLRHPDRRKESTRKYRENNREKVRRASIKWVRENREHCLANNRRYKILNADKERSYRRKYVSNKLKSDPCFKIKHLLRCRIKRALKSIKKSKRTEEMVGCDMDFLRRYFEERFKDGMSWGNHGVNGWHIDHIIPCAHFDLSDAEQRLKCFHYTNLQPLWAKENREKRDKLCA